MAIASLSPFAHASIAPALSSSLVGPLFVLGFIGLMVLIVVGAAMAQKRRREAIQATAAELGWTYEQEAGSARELALDTLPLLDRGRRRRFSNAVTGTIEDIRFVVCDYQYTTGSGKNSSTHHLTVAGFRVPGLQLPAFTCAPEGFFSRLGEKLGMQDIDFIDAPAFSDAFKLTGDDEPAIRAAFSRGLMDDLLAHPKWSLQGRGDTFIVCQQNRRLKPHELQPFLDDAMRLVLTLTAGG